MLQPNVTFVTAGARWDQISPKINMYLQEGNVKPFKKSEPIPKLNNEPVKVVVADSLQDVVFDSGKNGLFYELSMANFYPFH